MSRQQAADPADVVIVGGGPAGLATACALVQRGRSVTVLERSRYETPRIGETFPPEIRLPLSALGLWDGFLGAGHSPSPGIQCAWGGAPPYTNDSLRNPYGPGWHVDRRRFGATLAEHAETQGVTILRSARPTAFAWNAPGTWQLQFITGNTASSLSARMLVDATGRGAAIARRLGDRRMTVDRLVGLVGFVDSRTVANERDQRTLIEAVSDGWWYSALLPNGHHIAAFMTDADLLPRGTNPRRVHWEMRLRAAPMTHFRLDVRKLLCPVQVVPAGTSCLQSVVGDGRIAVGDAAAALDPLSAQGVYRALVSGIDAACAIDADLGGDPEALAGDARQVHAEFAADLAARADYYQREQRWPDSPFWKRRHAGSHSGRFPPGLTQWDGRSAAP